jgi:hypothetical protein
LLLLRRTDGGDVAGGVDARRLRNSSGGNVLPLMKERCLLYNKRLPVDSGEHMRVW